MAIVRQGTASKHNDRSMPVLTYRRNGYAIIELGERDGERLSIMFSEDEVKAMLEDDLASKIGHLAGLPDDWFDTYEPDPRD